MQKIMYNRQYGLEEAVIEERKNMTRRIAYEGEVANPNWGIYTDNNYACRAYLYDGERLIAKSKYHIGEIVAVAQSYKDIAGSNTWINSERMGISAKYAMTLPGWTNKMFVKAELMPVKQKCTDIKVERLQDISERDCLKEGVHKGQMIPVRADATFMDEKDIYYPFRRIDPYNWHYDYKKAFAILIDKVSGKGTWERNPWVFAYTFELVK